MRKLLVLTLITLSTSMFADPGITIDLEIIIERPSGKGGPEMARCS